MIHLEVAVAVPLYSTLTYLFNDETSPAPVEEMKERDETYVGRKVLVPLSGRIVTGFVLACLPCSEVDFKIREICRFVDETPFFPPQIVPFFRWVAGYYQHPIGEVISTALPAGLRQSSRKILRPGPREIHYPDFPDLQEDKRPQWLVDLEVKGKVGVVETRKLLADKKWKSLVQKLVASDCISMDKELSASLTGVKKETCYVSELSSCDVFDGEKDEKEKIKAFQRTVAERMQLNFKLSEAKALYYHQQLAQKSNAPVPRKDILAKYKNGSKPLNDLCQKGVLVKREERIYRNPFGEVPGYYPKPDKLSVEQQDVLATINTQLGKNVFAPFLLHGVTGSGKTEIYLRAAEKCLQEELGVLVLVPEIALATQLEAHFVSRFGKMIALLHSGLSRGQRYDQWALIAQGEARIVIGARSAVFAPLENIGLIIVDEEHDGGFKQQDGLKYNGRDLAVLRAKMFNCTVILGSATPAVTSYHHAVNGKYTLLKMISRVGEGGFPDVSVIDLNAKLKKSQKSPFHPTFLEELKKNLENNEQSLVLLNRRGFSASYICQDCGLAVQCQHCNVTLTYHKQRQQLVCHYCGYSVGSNLVCSNCHGEKLVPYGVGTERVEEELHNHFPDAVVGRLDSDTAGDRKKFLAILRSMQNREIDILIGTQMIAKGHHFPYVTFVGVVWADGGLNMPDFRAAERTYQLLSQVTGRAGRDELRGRVLIQTMLPDHYAIALAKRHDYTSFYQKEISLRRKPVFPPYVRLACIRISGENEFNVRKTSANIATACRSLKKSEDFYLDVLGPAPSPLGKIKDKYRWQILFKADQATTLHWIWQHITDNVKQLLLGGTEYRFDLDPENMM